MLLQISDAVVTSGDLRVLQNVSIILQGLEVADFVSVLDLRSIIL